MEWLDALILGIVQGLAEYLPISSSGHLEIFREILGIDIPSDKILQFDIILHAATVCSTIVVLWPMFKKLLVSFFSFKRDSEYGIESLPAWTPFKVFFILAVTFTLTFLIGYSDFEGLKFIALLLVNPCLYIFFCRVNNTGRISLLNILALSAAGYAFRIAMENPEWITIASLSIGVVLILYVCVDLALRFKKIWQSVLLFVGMLIINPLILGLNPFVAMDSESLRTEHLTLKVSPGLFITWKDHKVGLRNRYENLIEPVNERMINLDADCRYIAVLKEYAPLIKNQRWGIYDTKEKKFLVTPEESEYADFILCEENHYKIMDGKERFTTDLYMPGWSPELNDYIDEITFKQ